MTAQPALLSDLGGAPPCLHAPIVRRPNSFYRRRDRYPIDWLRLATEIKELCGYICQDCGKRCRRPGEPFDTVRRTLTIAHVWPADHAPDAEIVCCAPLCAPCHLRYDAERKAYARRHGEPGRMVYGVVQLELFALTAD
jgi:hypothetical protein